MAEYVIAGLAALLLVSEVRHWHALRRADAWMRAAAAWRTASLADTVERARSDAYAAALTDAVRDVERAIDHWHDTLPTAYAGDSDARAEVAIARRKLRLIGDKGAFDGRYPR